MPAGAKLARVGLRAPFGGVPDRCAVVVDDALVGRSGRPLFESRADDVEALRVGDELPVLRTEMLLEPDRLDLVEAGSLR
jgi:hypothetical protein